MVRQLIGFYPDPTNLPSFAHPIVAGKLKNDSHHEYDSKIEILLNETNFNNAINKIKTFEYVAYDIENFNCTSFAKEISAAAGVNLPSGIRTFGVTKEKTYRGVCPTGMHEDIFNWPNKPANVHNVQKFTNAQNAPIGNGKCL